MRLDNLKRQASGAVLAFVLNSAKTILITGAMAAALLPQISRAAEATIAFDIPAGTVEHALKVFTAQSGVRVLGDFSAAAHDKAPAVKGAYTSEAALRAILADSTLEIGQISGDRVSLRLKSQSGAAQSAGFWEEQTVETPTEVVVTGSHIRGGNPTSPVHTVTAKDIQQSGYSQIGDVIRNLPESFGGGQNPGVIGADFANIANTNSSGASTANLRGLGSDATLILVNGHRLTGDVTNQGADISPIPVGVVQRIEVVTDGASSLYGADAVAGVVNFVLRRDYDGVEVSANAGAASQGAATSRTLSVLAGTVGGKGHVLANLEYSQTDGITTKDRNFTSAATTLTTLVQPTRRQSFFVSGGYDFSTRLSFSADLLLSDRKMRGKFQQTPASYLYTTDIYTPSYSAAATLESKLGLTWKIRLLSVASGNRNVVFADYPSLGITNYLTYKNFGRYVEANADGTGFHLPSGDVKLAVGLGYRTEDYVSYTKAAFSRTVTYAYAEVLAPLVAPDTARTGLESLDLSLSGRSETYSDFGSTSSPKVGLRYVPFHTLTLRATWDKSFKAPSFQQMHGAASLYLWNAKDVGGSGTGTVLMTYGGNPNLKPEKATSKTFSAEYNPTPTVKLSASAFEIEYTDRVVAPVTRYYVGLSDPIYAQFIEHNPPKSRQDQLLAAGATFYNYSSVPYDPSQVVAVINDANANANMQTVRGLDVGYRQTFDALGGHMSAFANATWLNLRQQTSLTAPVQTLSGTVLNPPQLKARGGASWETNGLSATIIGNFLSGETDNLIAPNRDIPSWTTFDATLSYRFGQRSSYRDGVTISVAVLNLFDRMPPHALGVGLNFPGLVYDPTNTSVIGRFASLTLKKAW